MKFYFILIFLIVSLPVRSNEVVKEINLPLSKGMYELKVIKKNHRYYFNQELQSNKLLLGISEEHFFPYNKGHYSTGTGSNIGYSVGIYSMQNGLFHPNFIGIDNDAIPNSIKTSGNSIVFVTSQEDNRNFSFFIKYDYIPSTRRVELSSIYYFEQDRKDGSYGIFKVIDDRARNIKYLSNYNSKIMTEFIVKDLYKSRDKLKKILVDTTPDYVDYKNKLSLCDKNQKIKFSCQLQNSKLVSVCKNNDKLFYRYGEINSLELDKNPNWESRNYNEKVEDGDNEIIERYFQIGKYKYNIKSTNFIYHNEYTFHPEYELSVTKNEHKIFSKSCIAVSKYYPH